MEIYCLFYQQILPVPVVLYGFAFALDWVHAEVPMLLCHRCQPTRWLYQWLSITTHQSSQQCQLCYWNLWNMLRGVNQPFVQYPLCCTQIPEHSFHHYSSTSLHNSARNSLRNSCCSPQEYWNDRSTEFSIQDMPSLLTMIASFMMPLWQFYSVSPNLEECSYPWNFLFIISRSKLRHCYTINQQAIVPVVHYISTAKIIYHALPFKNTFLFILTWLQL